jgi:hypothetical protein
LREALEATLPRLEEVLTPLEKALEPHLETLTHLTARIQSQGQALSRFSKMIPDFVTKARFQSGLEDSQSMAEELKALFTDYLEQALFRPHSPSL